MLLKYCVGEDSWELLGQQGDPPINPKGNQSWIFFGRTDAEAETPILWPPDEKNWHRKRSSCWERLKAGEEAKRGWDGWMASLMQWTLVWVGSRSWWWTGEPGMQQSMRLQRVRHDWATELNLNFLSVVQIEYFLLFNRLVHCFFFHPFHSALGSLVVQLVKNLPAMQETPVWFLGQEDPLEKG